MSLPLAHALVSAPALAAEPLAAAAAAPAAAPEAPKWKSFIARDFLVRYPTTFKVVDDPASAPSTAGESVSLVLQPAPAPPLTAPAAQAGAQAAQAAG